MANVNEDVIRHEDTTANLPTSSRNGQVTFETDSNKRMRHALLSGEGHFWTPDDKFTAALPTYTNGSYPSIETVKDALDYILSLSSPVQSILTGNLDSDGQAIIVFPSGFNRTNCVILSCMIQSPGGGSDFYMTVGSGGDGTMWSHVNFGWATGPTSVIAITVGADTKAIYASGTYKMVLQKVS